MTDIIIAAAVTILAFSLFFIGRKLIYYYWPAFGMTGTRDRLGTIEIVKLIALLVATVMVGSTFLYFILSLRYNVQPLLG